MIYEAEGKMVLITGTSTGIGRATALYLDQMGFYIIATVRKEDDAEELQAAASSHLRTLLLDVTNATSLARAEEALEQHLGNQGLWGLVNNAGVAITGPLEFVPLDQMRQLFEVNLFGVLAVTQICLPFLRQAQGRIINVSSTASIVVAPFHGPYSSSKSSLNALSNALRLELRPFGIQVSTLVCGIIKTPIWTKGREESDRVWKNMPMDAEELYGARYHQLRSYFHQLGQDGVPPEKAARIIADALTTDRAKQTYYIGSDAWKYRLLNKISGERLRDWIILRTIGLDV